VVVKTTKGIFRFVTGSQRPQNYLITTPIASIGVRGTIFDLLVMPDRVTVILIEGQILVTTLFNRTITLSQPGTSITVYANGRVAGPSVWRGSVYVDFASANFPYFPPVTAIKRKAAVPPNVRTATVPPREVERPRRNPGYSVSSRGSSEPQTGIRVRIPIPKVDRPPRQRETKHYPPPQKQYPTPTQKHYPNLNRRRVY
jgi:hypothetical protein